MGFLTHMRVTTDMPSLQLCTEKHPLKKDPKTSQTALPQPRVKGPD